MSGKATMCALGLALAVCEAKAEPVLFQFSGEVTHGIEVPEEGHPLSGAIVVGTAFSGTHTLESTTPDSAPQVAWWGEYYGAIDDLGGAIHGELGDVGFQGPVFLDDLGQESNHVVVRKSWDSAWDHHTFVAGVDVLGLSFEFRWGYHPPYWSDQYPLIDSLPINPPPFEDLTITYFSFRELEPVSGEPASFRGQLTSLSVVPEPTTGMLLLAAGGLLLARRHGRTRSSTGISPRYTCGGGGGPRSTWSLRRIGAGTHVLPRFRRTWGRRGAFAPPVDPRELTLDASCEREQPALNSGVW